MFSQQPSPINQDMQLWHSFQQGSEQSFTYLHDSYYNQLYFYGLKIIADDEQVKNAIQELFLHLWKNRRQLNPVHSVRHYLLCSFRRHLFRLLEKEKQQKKFAQSNEADRFVFSVEDLIVHEETESMTRTLLAEALNQLPPRQRELIYLRYTAGLTPSEIAALLQVNYQSVLNTLARAIGALRNRMAVTAPAEGVVV